MGDSCPQCSAKTNRLIKEVCGHYKCRDCFIKEEFECNECIVINCSTGPLSNQDQTDIVLLEIGIPRNEDLEGNSCCDKSVNSVVENEANEDSAVEPESRSAMDQSANQFISKKSMGHIIKLTDGNKESYKCSICNKCFHSRSQRYYHIYCNESYKKPFSCEICSKRFSSSYHLKYHQEIHKSNQQYKCPTCSKIFSRRLTFDKHMKNHDKNIKFICPTCNAVFKDKYAFRSHTDKHKNIYPFSCQHCDKKFSLKSTFKQHQLVHSGKTLFECSDCKKRFKRKSSYKAHILRHSKIRQHLCEVCRKVFGDIKSLQRHKRIHDESTYYKCLYCSVKSKRKDNLSRHVRNMHPAENITDSIQKDVCVISVTNTEQNITDINKGNSDEIKSPNIDQVEANEYVNERERLQKCSVIKTVGNVKSVIIPRDESCSNVKGACSTKTEDVSNSQESSNKKRKKKYDPLEIYRKILLVSNDDDSLLEEENADKNTDSQDSIRNSHEAKMEPLYKPSIQQNFAEVHWRRRTFQYFSSINT